MIRALLVAVDSSLYARSAIEHAIELGRCSQARLMALHVLDVRYLEMPPYLDYAYVPEAVPPVVLPSEVMERFRAKSERLLQEAREEALAAGLVVETRAVEGVPSQVIADLGASHDLVVLGKRGEHAKWGRDLLGSTAEQVTRRSATPVLLAEVEPRTLHRALLLFDGSPPANRALKLVADLATRVPLQLEVLTVDDDLARAAAVQEEAAAYLRPAEVAASYVVLPGRAAKVAPQRLKDASADVLILGMRGHSVLHNLILGSTAEQLMRQVPLPVLLVP
jgi:nucleotide-binding universal stress UspA family protein